MNLIKRLLPKPGFWCRRGIHRPLTNHVGSFIDRVSGKTVYEATCPCGRKWLVDSPFGWGGHKLMKGVNKK